VRAGSPMTLADLFNAHWKDIVVIALIYIIFKVSK
jgi:hypothetical protein